MVGRRAATSGKGFFAELCPCHTTCNSFFIKIYPTMLETLINGSFVLNTILGRAT